MDRKVIFLLIIGVVLLFSGKKKASNLSGVKRKTLGGLGDKRISKRFQKASSNAWRGQGGNESELDSLINKIYALDDKRSKALYRFLDTHGIELTLFDRQLMTSQLYNAMKKKNIATQILNIVDNKPKGQMQLFDVPSLNLRGLTMAEIEKIIGGRQVSNLFKEGGIVYKPTVNTDGQKTFEPEAYKALTGTEGVAPARTVKRDGLEYIAYPLYPHIISRDEIPDKEDRKDVIPIIAKNIPRINRAIASVTNKGICYADWLQFGLNDKHQMDLLDFSNSQPCKNPVDDNYMHLYNFYFDFGLDRLQKITERAMRYKTLLEIYAPEEVRRGKTLKTYYEENKKTFKDEEILKQILYSRDVKPNNVYYATNWRHINLPVGQTEPIDDVKYVYSDKKLSQKDIDSWELTPVYEQPEPDEPKYKMNPDWTWELKAEKKEPKKKLIEEKGGQMTLFGRLPMPRMEKYYQNC
jgi:hypothetical protein